jgi:hypothetical protein
LDAVLWTEPGEMVDEAVAVLDDLLREWAGQSRPFAGPDLLSALRGRLRRWLLERRRSANDTHLS